MALAGRDAFLGVGLPLQPPLDLASLGAPGCLVSLDPVAGITLVPGVTVGGAGAWSLTVPPAYSGTFALQCYLFEPTADPLGIVVSNGLLAATS